MNLTQWTGSQSDNSELPPWFKRPRSREVNQRSLFPACLTEILVDMDVSSDDLRRWHEKKWISFDPELMVKLETEQEREIRFVRNVVRSGLTDVQIEQLLERLPAPFAFDPSTIAYSFSFGWVTAVWKDPASVVEEHLDDWLDGLVSDGNLDKLKEVRAWITSLIEEEFV